MQNQTKYWAKFLPVEEKIEEGDIVLYKGEILELNEFTLRCI